MYFNQDTAESIEHRKQKIMVYERSTVQTANF